METLSYVSNVVLAVTAIIGIIVAIGTLRSIKSQGSDILRQAQAAEEAAKSAKTSTDAFIVQNRPWILVNERPKPKYPDGWYKSMGQPAGEIDFADLSKRKPEFFGYRVKNFGRSPGWVTSHWSTIRTAPKRNDLPSPPPYFSALFAISVKDPVLYTPKMQRRNKISPPIIGIPDSVATQDEFLYAFGIITYRDALGQEHETRFCFLWHTPKEGDINPQGWYAEGPEEYIRET